ncbi:MAG: ABC transporter substrate-binding protein [Chthoniobacteraceae bacterium]|nr:ABC transporter substrate-binding protein [Chthoniobacteraceae bacterium]
MKIRFFALLLLALAACSAFAEPPARPVRIVSVCLQGDQYLLQLVPRERIAALSQFAADPDLSEHWEAARGIPTTKGGAEELARLRPDLVLVSAFSPHLSVAVLKQHGVRVLELGLPNDFEQLRAQIRLAGDAVGEPERAEALVRSMDARLARLEARRPPPAQRPEALFYFQDGFTPGAHTFANALLEAAGFRNLGARFSAGMGASAPLEAVLTARPRFLILTRYREANPTQTQVGPDAPLFRRLGPECRVLRVSFRHLAAADPANLELAEMLQQSLVP